MKSKQNSKAKPTKPASMLVPAPHRSHQPLLAVPTHHSPASTRMNLSKNSLTSTLGIQKYTCMRYLNLNDNNIENLQQLKYLKYCPQLEEVTFYGNPVVERVNYLYGFGCLMGRALLANGVRVDCARARPWQAENGARIGQFLYQKCVILNDVLAEKCTLQPHYEQLHRVKAQLQRISSRGEQFITAFNACISQLLPLKSIPCAEPSPSQFSQIKTYYLQKIISNTSPQGQDFLYKLLSGIEVVPGDEAILANDKQLTQKILTSELESEYRYSRELTEQTDEDGKHFTSAETALDTAYQTNRGMNWALEYFCYEVDFLKSIQQIMIEEVAKLIAQLENWNTSGLNAATLVTQHTEINRLKSEENGGLSLLCSPQKVYYNSSILSGIVDMLQGTIKSITLRKMKVFNSKNYTKFASFMAYLLQRPCQRVLDNAAAKIINYLRDQYRIQQVLQAKKLKRLFLAWKKIKARKLKLLKTILKRKIKADTFLATIALAKWRMNIRYKELQRKASAVILRASQNTTMPCSKKGIELAYKRTMSSKKLRVR